jgi:hypothetical protein
MTAIKPPTTERNLQKSLLDKPEAYVDILRKTFRIRNAYGQWSNYNPEPYQVEWHKDFVLPNMPDIDEEDTVQNRILNKCRGIGATAMTMMDLIMMAATYDGLTIPVASMTGKQALRGPIWWGLQLCDNTAVPGIIPRDQQIQSEIRIESTGSVIFLIPGSSPQTLRTYRTPVIFYDEYDWCEYQRELLDSGESCMSEGGQATIVSTIQNVRGEFQRIVNNAENLNYKVHYVPMFDPNTFDPSRDILEQMEDGLIKPIAPWIDLKRLERIRRRDLDNFLRENMCHAPDAGVNYLSWELISSMCSIPQVGMNYEGPDFGWRGNATKKYIRQWAEKGHAYTIGWDYARYKDLSVVEVVEHTPFGITQVYEETMRGSDTVLQNDKMDLLVLSFNPVEVRIDMTGSGQGLYDYAVGRHGSKIEGVSFGRSVALESDYGETKVKAKDLYAINLRRLAQDNKARLFDYLELKDDLNSIPYDLGDPRRTQEGSHGDRFWALALAAYTPFDNSPFAFYGDSR